MVVSHVHSDMTVQSDNQSISVKTDSSTPRGLDICLSFVGRGHHYAQDLSQKGKKSLLNVFLQEGCSRVHSRSQLAPWGIRVLEPVRAWRLNSILFHKGEMRSILHVGCKLMPSAVHGKQ